jgi:heme-degrading monooxygenase HmoA
MDTAQPPARTHLFTVRVWLEELGAGQAEWRGEVQHVVSGETRYFRDWPALVASMQAMLPEQGGGDGPGRTIQERPASTRARTGPSREEPHMIASLTTGGRVQPDQIDEVVAGFRSLLPRAKQAPGFQGLLLAADRRTGKMITVGLWESEAAAQAAESLYQEALRELGRFIAEPPTRERYEVLLQA